MLTSMTGDLLLAQWILPVPDLRAAYYASTYRSVFREWSDNVGCWWRTARIVCVCQWVRVDRGAGEGAKGAQDGVGRQVGVSIAFEDI